MDAPIYPPPAAYNSLVVAPYTLSASGCSILDIMSRPDAWSVVLKHVPTMKFLVGQMKPYLGNLFLADVGLMIGQPDAAALSAIDQELRSLPATLVPAP
jgi:hypothetical protein